MTAKDQDYARKWRQANPCYQNNWKQTESAKELAMRRKEEQERSKIKKENDINKLHRETIFTGGHTNSDRNLGINYDYSEGDVL